MTPLRHIFLLTFGLCGISFCGVNIILADEWTRTSAPTNFWQCACSADGATLVAGVQDGGIYFSLDGGEIWNPSEAPNEIWKSMASSADGKKLVAVLSYFKRRRVLPLRSVT